MGGRITRVSGKQIGVWRIIFHLPTVFYLLFILFYPYFSPGSPGGKLPWDKFWHISVYFLLPFFLFFSFLKVEKKFPFPGIFLIGIPWAFIDEFPQMFISSRKFEFKDLLMDISGIVLGGIMIYMLFCRNILRSMNLNNYELKKVDSILDFRS